MNTPRALAPIGLLLLLPFLVCASCGQRRVNEPPATEPAGPQIAPEPAAPPSPWVEASLVEPLTSWPASAREAMARGDLSAAALILQMSWGTAPVDAERAFVLAWLLSRAGRVPEALTLLDRISSVDSPQDSLPSRVPAHYLRLLRARLLNASARPDQALALLESFPESSRLARDANLERARSLQMLQRNPEAIALLEALIADPTQRDSAEEAAIRELILLVPLARAQELRMRIWTRHPTSLVAPTEINIPRPPTFAEIAARAEVLQNSGDFQGTVKLLEPITAQLSGSTEESCRARFALGRAYSKLNKSTETSKAFGTGPADCAEVGEYGKKIRYLAGRAEARRGQHRVAAGLLLGLADHWPEDSMADDGLVLAGISLKKAGDIAGARKAWSRAIERYPQGDLTAKGAFQLAWSHYEVGESAQAVAAALKLAELPGDLDLGASAFGRYLAGRWSLHPDPRNPQRRVEAGRALAIEQWSRLCREQPWSYGAVLAWNHLRAEAPEQAEALQFSGPRPPPRSTWTLPRSFWEDPHLQTGLSLLSLGLLDEAREELRLLDESTFTPSERAFLTLSRARSGDSLRAHIELRAWAASWAPAVDDPLSLDLMRAIFPDSWWPEAQAASKPYRFPPRFFHAIIRVESNFDPNVLSSAGARGLSQVMPATGRTVGKWMGMKVQADDLLDPLINLQVGARYQESLHKRFNNDPFLAAAAYNAGEGRVDKWLKERGDLPIDDFVEQIPFEETRLYVRRVIGTWQAYRWIDGTGLPQIDRKKETAKP